MVLLPRAVSKDFGNNSRHQSKKLKGGNAFIFVPHVLLLQASTYPSPRTPIKDFIGVVTIKLALHLSHGCPKAVIAHTGIKGQQVMTFPLNSWTSLFVLFLLGQSDIKSFPCCFLQVIYFHDNMMSLAEPSRYFYKLKSTYFICSPFSLRFRGYFKALVKKN